jgi:septal ring factor EnvC (AmiA/AmiB activator)
MATKTTTLESLGTLITKGSESTDKKITALAEDITDIKSTMATKDDIARLDTRLQNVETSLTSIEADLRSIRRDLEDLREKFENVSGFREENDHALERIAAIERHLGIEKKIAA